MDVGLIIFLGTLVLVITNVVIGLVAYNSGRKSIKKECDDKIRKYEDLDEWFISSHCQVVDTEWDEEKQRFLKSVNDWQYVLTNPKTKETKKKKLGFYWSSYKGEQYNSILKEIGRITGYRTEPKKEESLSDVLEDIKKHEDEFKTRMKELDL